MKILLVAPDQSNIDSVPEIRVLSGIHRVQVLNGRVTAQDVFQEARRTERDVIHFATHGGPNGLVLSTYEQMASDGTHEVITDTLTAEDILQLVKLSKARMLFFNACNTSKIASYCVRHGLFYAICANEQILDRDAWKFPVTYYQILDSQKTDDDHLLNYALAFESSDSGDGTYSFIINLSDYISRPSLIEVTSLVNRLDSMQKELIMLNKNLADTRHALRYSITANIGVTAVFIFVLLFHLLGVL